MSWMGLPSVKYGLIFFFIEALLLSGATTTGQNAITNAQNFVNLINGNPPTPPNTAGCTSVWWNPTTWGCSISNLAQVMWYYLSVGAYYVEQIGGSLLVPFIMVGSVAYYSAEFWWLAVINAIVLVMMIAELVHGLI